MGQQHAFRKQLRMRSPSKWVGTGEAYERWEEGSGGDAWAPLLTGTKRRELAWQGQKAKLPGTET